MTQLEPKPKWLVFDAEATGDADFTATTMLAQLVGTMREQETSFAVAEPNGRLEQSLQRAGIEEMIGTDKIFPSVDAAARAYVTQYPAATPPRK